MLKVEGIHAAYGDMAVLWDMNLQVAEGEIVTVVGSNGAGKSTLLRVLSRLLKPTSGTVTFLGEDLSKLPPHDVVGRGIIHVPEGRKIFPEMSVLENLRMGSYLESPRANRERNLERVFTLFPRLKEREAQLGGTLSGGEQQMLAIGRGLMGDPKLLLLDEPSLGLSPLFVKNIFSIIKDIHAQGISILLVEQNVNQALQLADRAYVLETGRLVMQGPGPELLASDEVRKAFLGM
jgi:branched-chain amino acid transport system ATP-binding protein